MKKAGLADLLAHIRSMLKLPCKDLSTNIPFIKSNLSPLSFIDVPRAVYMDAILGVYELNNVDLLRDVFIWAYERSGAPLCRRAPIIGRCETRTRISRLQAVGCRTSPVIRPPAKAGTSKICFRRSR